MSFDPVRVHRTVLEFYLTTVALDDGALPTISCDVNKLWIAGQAQQYEQLLLFLYGHFFPDFLPFAVELHTASNNFRTSCLLPPTSHQACHQLFEGLAQDERLIRLMQGVQARIRTCLNPPCVVLDMASEPALERNETTRIDYDELKTRYGNLAVARQLYEGFFSHARRHLDQLRLAFGEQNYDEVFRHIHALKGGALNLAVPRLVSVCQEFELLVKKQCFFCLDDYITQIINELEALEHEYKINEELFIE